MKKSLFLAAAMLAALLTHAQTYDPAFQPVFSSDGSATSGLLLNDSEYILAGSFIKAGTEDTRGIAKFNSDGSLDNSFDTGTGIVGTVHDMAAQTDGKVIVIGRISKYNDVPLQSMVIRLNTDGSLDETFLARVNFSSGGSKIHLKILGNGKIIIVGPVNEISGVSRNEDIIRLNIDGTLDETFDGPNFNGSIMGFDIQDDGKIVTGGVYTSIDGTTTNRIVRLNTNGTVDNTFVTGTGFDSWVFDVKVLGTDRILFTGSFTTYQDAAMKALVALKADGSVDATFSGNGKLTSGLAQSMATQSDGSILLTGSLNTFDGNSSIENIIRLTTAGALDGTFTPGTGPNGSVTLMKINNANEIIILGESITSYNGQARNGVAILNSDGSLKATAVTPLYVAATTQKIQKQGTDKILVGHSGDYLNGVASDGFERLNLDGSVDATFNGGPINNQVNDIIIDQNDNIVIGGPFTSYNSVSVGNIARLSANGTLDATFNTNTGTGFNGTVTVIEEQPDGKLIVGGSFTAFNGTNIKSLARLNADGTLDNGFNVANGFSATPAAMEVFRVLPDGKILVGGAFDSFDGHNVKSLIRLNDDGSFDETFNIGTGLYRDGSASSDIYALEVLEDGKILAGGSFDRANGVNVFYCVRLNSDGSLDNTYTDPSLFIVDAFGKQDDGKIFAGSRTPDGLSRLYKNGLLDPTFNVITSPGIRDILYFDKQIIIGGILSTVSGFPVTGMAKITLPDDPAAPTALSVNVISHASASMTWTDNATNEDGYKVERSTPDNASFQVIQTLAANVTTFQDNSVQGNTTYYYRVASFNAASDDNYSNEETITTPVTPPATPSGLTISVVSSTQLDLSWTDNANDETAYEVERSTGDADNFEPLISLGADVTQHSDNALTAGTVYYYRVRAVNGTVYSAYTTAVSAIPSVAAPSSLALDDPTPTSVQLTWTDNAIDEDEYIVKRSDGGNLNYITIATLPADTESFTDSGLTAGTVYYYIVQAANANSESEPVSGNITPGIFIMANGTNSLCDGVFYDPGGEFVYDNNLNVTTTFLPSTTGASLQIEFQYFATQFLFDALSIYDGTDVSAPLIGIFDSSDDPGTIRATNADGALTFQFQSDGSSVTSGWKAYFSCVIVPQEPSAVDVEPVNTSHVKVTWTDNSDNETGFVVERSVDNASSFNTIADLPPNATFYDDNDVTSNTTFYYRVKAKGDETDSDFAPMTALAYGEGIWKLKADFDGIARTDATAFSIDNKGYLGLGWAGGAQANNFRAYDPATNTWSVIDSYGGSIRSEAASFVIGSKAYVGTGEGFDLENDLWEYDPALNDWTAKADFGGTPRRGAVGFSINGKGYIALGTDASGRTNDVWQYDPAGDAWTEVAPFPGSARTGAVAFVINNIAYVGTGSTSSGNTNDFWKYDAGSNTWTTINVFPGNARRHAVAFALDNKGYVATGESTSNHDDLWEYDPSTDTWREVLSFGGSARFAATAFATSAHGYVATGFDGSERKDLWEFTITDVAVSPEAPQEVTATAISFSEVNLTWQYAAGNASGFVIERSIGDGSSYTVLTTQPAGGTSYTDMGLDPSTTYYYRIKATTDLFGNSAYSTASATTLPPLPVVPSDLQVWEVTNTSLTLTWTTHSSASEFRVERSEGTDDNFQEVAIVSGAPYYDTDLTSETRYYYRVRAMNVSGFSDYSDTLMVETPESPIQAPSNLAAVVTSSSLVSLTWTDNANNETEFHVYRSVNNANNFVPIIILAFPDANSYTDINLDEVTTYYYKVKAVAGVMESDFSNIVSVTTPFSIPAAPTELTAQLNEEETLTTLTWIDNADNENDFVIERSYDDGDFAEIGATSGTTYEDTQISEAIKRSYRVRARNAAGSSAYSNVASVTITVPEPVTGIGEIMFGKSVTVYPNPAADHVVVEFSQPETGNVEIELSDLTGKVITTQTFGKSEMLFSQRINMVKPSGGMILMKVSLNKMTAVKKVIFK